MVAAAACGEVKDTSSIDPPPDGCTFDCEPPSCAVPATHASLAAALDDASCTTIAVAAGTYTENLSIARDVRLAGAGAASVVIDGGGRTTTVTIAAGATVSIEGATIRNGDAARGGGIANHGALALRDARVEANRAVGRGGGIYSDGGSLTLVSTIVADNHVVPDPTVTPPVAAGGGIYVASGALTITGGAVERNDIKTASPVGDLAASGAGIASDGDAMTITGASISTNAIEVAVGSAGMARVQGGGIAAMTGTVTLAMAKIGNNTIFVNGDLARVGGGGIAARGVVATSSTIAENAVQVFGAGSNPHRGGGIQIVGSTPSKLIDSVVRDNSIALTPGIEGGIVAGGGIALGGVGDLEIEGSTIAGNSATGVGLEISASGGAVSWLPDATANTGRLTITRTTIDRNLVKSFYGAGGAISVGLFTAGHALVITASTISANTIDGVEAAVGGGVDVSSIHPNGMNTVTIASSTFSGNLAKVTTAQSTAGGGALALSNQLANGMLVNIASTTIAGNRLTGTTTGAGGIQLGGNVRTQLGNTIIATNLGPSPDCAPGFTSRGHNLLGSATGCTIQGPGNDRVGGAANLAALDSNGGPTKTHALLVGSVALDAADPLGCSDTNGLLIHDQRGQPRIVNGRCDIGAFER